MAKRSQRLLFLLLSFIIIACESRVVFIEKPSIKQSPNESTPLAAVLKYQTDQPISVTAQITTDGHSFSTTLEETDDASAGLPVIGMKAGRDYTISLKLKSQYRITEYEEKLTYSTPELPSDPYEIPGFSVERNQTVPMEPGITLLNPRLNAVGRDGRKFGMLVAVDSIGDVIWYYRCDSRVSDFNFLPNRHISYMTADHRFIEIDLLGNVIKSYHASMRPEGDVDNSIPIETRTFHHDAQLLPNGNYVILGSTYREIEDYYTSETDINAPRKTQKVMGDLLLEFTPAGEVVWDWDAFDHYDPMRIGYNTFNKYWYSRGYPGVLDWTHANTVLHDPSDNTVIMNSRFLSSLTKINKDGSIKWIFGEPTGLSEELKEKSLKIKNGDWFWHQHSASFTPHGTILIFNNDLIKAWPFQPKDNTGTSHAVEFKINEEAMEAEQIWSSETPELKGVKSVAMGDVDYLNETGNVFVSYGAVAKNEAYGRSRQWSMVREFTREIPTSIAWELQLWPAENYQDSISWVLFSAERINGFF